MNIEDMVRQFERFNACNDEALKMIAELSGSSCEASQCLDPIFSLIYDMRAAAYFLFCPGNPFVHGMSKDEYYEALGKQLLDVKRNAAAALKSGNAASLDNTDISPVVRKRILGLKADAITGLNAKLEGEFDEGTIGLPELRTPHDLVRYLHRVVTDMFYDPNGDKWCMDDSNTVFTINGNKMFLRLMAVGEDAKAYAAGSPFIQRFIDIVESGRFVHKYSDYDRFFGLANRDYLSIQMPLGCHYATLRVRMPGDSYSLNLRFTDTTSYSTSKFRTDVTEGILHRMDYRVHREKNIITAQADHDSLQCALDSFEHILRLCVSLKDVDNRNLDSVAGRKEDIVDAFLHGVLNLYDYIERWKPGSYEEWVDEHSCHIELPGVKKMIDAPQSSLEEGLCAMHSLHKDTNPHLSLLSKLKYCAAGMLLAVLLSTGAHLLTRPSYDNITSLERQNVRNPEVRDEGGPCYEVLFPIGQGPCIDAGADPNSNNLSYKPGGGDHGP